MTAQSRIPKASAKDSELKIPKYSFIPKDQEKNIVFSFEALTTNEYFNLDMTCQNWAAELFEKLHSISSSKLSSLISSSGGQSTRIHDHSNSNPPLPIPYNIDKKDLYQIRIGTSKGGIHGVPYENIFYVIWFDPLHNMYPDERYGGLKKIKSPSTCCMDRDSLVKKLGEEKEALQRDIDSLLTNEPKDNIIRTLEKQIEMLREENRLLSLQKK